MNVNNLAKRFEKLKNKGRRHSYISITDNGCINIEFCHGVIKFEEEQIVLELAKSLVTIVGLELSMKNYGYKNVKIYGKIHSISFDNNIERDVDYEKKD